MRILTIFIFFTALLFSCQGENTQTSEKSVDEIKAEGKISSIIRNPVTANEPTDTVNVAKMVFEETSYNFGEIEEGEIVNHTYKFTNTGTVPLLISNARSTCGCTVPVWPKDPVAPGESGELKVEFNSKGKKNTQKKPVTITANTYPSSTKVFLEGYVKSKEGEVESKE